MPKVKGRCKKNGPCGGRLLREANKAAARLRRATTSSMEIVASGLVSLAASAAASLTTLSTKPLLATIKCGGGFLEKWFESGRAWRAADAVLRAHAAGVPYCKSWIPIKELPESRRRWATGGFGVRGGGKRWLTGLYTWQNKPKYKGVVDEWSEFLHDIAQELRDAGWGGMHEVLDVAARFGQLRQDVGVSECGKSVGWVTNQLCRISPPNVCGFKHVHHTDSSDLVPTACFWIPREGGGSRTFHLDGGSTATVAPLDICIFDSHVGHHATNNGVSDGGVSITMYSSERIWSP